MNTSRHASLLLLATLACTDGSPTADGTDGDDPSVPAGTLSVLSTVPADGAEAVALDVTVEAVLDGDLDEARLSAVTFRVEPTVPGVYGWDPSRDAVTFDPTAPLAPDTTFTVTLTEGLGLVEATAWSFTTAGDTGTPGPTLPDPDATHTFAGDTVTVAVDDPAAAHRVYTLTTTHPLRDDLPANGTETIYEVPGELTLRSGSLLFDSLFAMAIQESLACSVSSISDGAFNNGQGVPCECFETGEKWNYVWTRDTAYAADLGLAFLDPQRTANSLGFKLSAPKAGGPLHIVQDTGSGGSWPVSTDRVVWALGARETLRYLPEPDRTAFRDDALEAMAATLAEDRTAVYDPVDGLYRGEQSFLDWREQSYPPWTAQDTVHLGMSKALSTNLGHHILLTTAAELGAETGHPDAATWAAQADALAQAIRDRLWMADDGLLSTLITTELDPSPLRKWDLLGESLAVLEGVADATQAPSIVRHYPHTEMGPPVLWPQNPGIPIYHNRGIWPFVTAYGLLAAKAVGNDAVFDHDLESLVRGAALNLSHMENFEFLTQANWVDAGAESGPVVNSRRQLWSVAGYLGMVVRGVFGLTSHPDGITFEPFVTAGLRDGWLADTDVVTLHDMDFRGATFDVVLQLPPVGTLADGAYAVASVTLDGTDVSGQVLDAATLSGASTLRLTLTADGATPGDTVTVVPDVGDHRDFWAPREPSQVSVSDDPAGLALSWDANGETDVVFHVYRDGERVADGLTATSWVDTTATPDTVSHCYALEAEYTTSGHASHHSPPVCWWGDGGDARIQTFGPHALSVESGDPVWSDQHGRLHLGDWGDPDDVVMIHGVRPRYTGLHWVQPVHGNGAGPINTGITASVKRVEVYDVADDTLVGEGTVMMPHLGTWSRWADGSVVPVDLDAARAYRIEIHDAPNMSYLDHFVPYTGGLGGGDTPFNRANLHAVKLLPAEGTPSPTPEPLLAFDGTDDLDAFDASQVLPAADLGDALAPWSAFALDWDDEALYLTLVTQGFEEDYAPWMVYLAASDGPFAAPATAEAGSDYIFGSVTAAAQVPFVPTHQVTLRAETGVGPQGGPWNGVWRRDAPGDLTQLRRLEQGVDWWLSADRHTVSAVIPRALLGADVTHLRLAAHLIWGDTGGTGGAFTDRVPAGHDPASADGGAFLEIDLTAAPDASGWTLVAPD